MKEKPVIDLNEALASIVTGAAACRKCGMGAIEYVVQSSMWRHAREVGAKLVRDPFACVAGGEHDFVGTPGA